MIARAKILYATLHKLIGRKSFNEVGALVLGMSVTREWFHSQRSTPSLSTLSSDVVISVPVICHVCWKNEAEKLSGPGALLGCRLNAIARISSSIKDANRVRFLSSITLGETCISTLRMDSTPRCVDVYNSE